MRMKLMRLAAVLLAASVGLELSFTSAGASTITFNGTFSTAFGTVFHAGDPFSGTINYDPATAVFVGGTSSFAQYTESTSITVLTGATTYNFPLWEIFVLDNGIHDIVQFIATDFSTNLLITDQPERSALLPPAITDAVNGAVFHIYFSDTSQASGEATVSVSAVPLHSTWWMTILGFAGIGFMAYRRKTKAALKAV